MSHNEETQKIKRKRQPNENLLETLLDDLTRLLLLLLLQSFVKVAVEIIVQERKKGTKGVKEILEENVSTLNFYRNMVIGANALSLIILVFYHSTISIFLYCFSCIIYIAALGFMVYMAKPQYTETGQLLDSGLDLNLEGSISDLYIKDIIILTAGCQILSAIISNYFWLLWLLAPLRGVWLAWENILQPYFFQQAPNEPEVNEKKQK